MLEFVLSVPKLARRSIKLLNVTANQFGVQFVINRRWRWRSQRCGVDAFFDWCWAGAVRGDRYSLWVTSRRLRIRSLYANIWPGLPLYSTRGENTLASIKSPAIDRYRCSIKTCVCVCVFFIGGLLEDGGGRLLTASWITVWKYCVCFSHLLVVVGFLSVEYVFVFAQWRKIGRR